MQRAENGCTTSSGVNGSDATISHDQVGLPLSVQDIVDAELETPKQLHPMARRVWERYVTGTSRSQIARALNLSAGVVARCVQAYTEHLREIHDPLEQAAARGIVLHHTHDIADFGRQIMEDGGLEIKERLAGAMIRLKAIEQCAKYYGLADGPVDNVNRDQQRMNQVFERMRLVGPHARAKVRDKDFSILQDLTDTKVPEPPADKAPPVAVKDGLAFEVV